MTDHGDNPYSAPQTPAEPQPDTGHFKSVVGWLAVMVTLAVIALLEVVSVLG